MSFDLPRGDVPRALWLLRQLVPKMEELKLPYPLDLKRLKETLRERMVLSVEDRKRTHVPVMHEMDLERKILFYGGDAYRQLQLGEVLAAEEERPKIKDVVNRLAAVLGTFDPEYADRVCSPIDWSEYALPPDRAV